MKRLSSKLIGSFLAFSVLTLFSFTESMDQKVKGWFLAGSSPGFYEIGVEKNSERGGNVAFLKSTVSEIPDGFGTIMQSFEPLDFVGKKIKLSAYLKTTNVQNWSGMWMRIDGEKREMLGFDNMNDRPIKGTTNWSKYEIILEVPKTAKGISYGVLTTGTGEVLMDDFKFEIIKDNSTSTGYGNTRKLTKPANTNFEEYN